jgi:hypothetical protein
MIWLKIVVLVGIVALISACGGEDSGSSGGDNSGGDGSGGAQIKLSSIILFDASKNPLDDANVTFSNSQSSKGVGTKIPHKNKATALRTNTNGEFQIPNGLAPGAYVMKVTKDNVESVSVVKVSADTQSGSSSSIIPLAVDGSGNWSNITGTAILASLSGTITDANGPISGALVTVSGGAATNGQIAAAVTNSGGHFNLLVNAKISLNSKLLNSTVTVSKSGYNNHQVTGFQVVNGTNVSGLNFVLTEDNGIDLVEWSETFENPATLADWTPKRSTGNEFSSNGWAYHESGQNIVNEALAANLVVLAANDSSLGRVPEPVQGNRAIWYGGRDFADNFDTFGAVRGNFLEDEDPDFSFPFDGGTSYLPHSGEAISPVINLTHLVEGEDISVTFDTYWEIESTNPNANGFDTMTVAYSIDGGPFVAQARLNPLSDPQDGEFDRNAIPYTNTGYNSAPIWAVQEPIPLPGAAGHEIQLMFAFDTVDELHNGFRGWLIDDIKVQASTGTFPQFVEGEFGEENYPYLYVGFDPVTYLPSISPASFDPVTFNTLFLNSGSNTNFSADVLYNDTGGTGTFKLQLIYYDFDNDIETLVAESAAQNYSMTDIDEESANISAPLSVPSQYDFLELWVEMEDSDGFVTGYNLAYYSVQ